MMLRSTWIALTAVLLLGTAVRLYGLTDYGVWFDEAYHIQLVQLPGIANMLEAVLSNPPSDPLYVLLLRAWAAIFGHSDLSVRALSVLLGSATIPAVYWLGRVVAGRAVGMFAALLLAVSPYAVEFSQEAALYALASLTTTLALAAGWRWRSTGSGRLLYLAAGTIAIYSHYVVAVILALFALLGLCTARESATVGRRSWLLVNGAVFLLWSPWLVAMILYSISSAQPRATLPQTVTSAELVGALSQFSSGTAALLQGERALQLLGLLSGAALLFAGWRATLRFKVEGSRFKVLGSNRNDAAMGLRLIVVISALVFFLPAIASMITGRWLFVPHFMLFLLPSMLVVLSAGIIWAWLGPKVEDMGDVRSWSKVRSLLPLLLLVPWLIAQVWGLALFYRYPPHGADGLRELASVLRASARPGDPVFVTPPVLTPTLRQYYAGDIRGLPVNFDLRAVYLPYDAAAWYQQSIKILDAEAASRERFWLVYRPELDDMGKLIEYITGRYRVISRHSYIYAELYLLEHP